MRWTTTGGWNDRTTTGKAKQTHLSTHRTRPDGQRGRTGGQLRFVPLGGLGEIGKNMMVIEYGDDIVIVDGGLMFPDHEMLGVDLVIPDTSYLADKLDRIKGIFITHGHEDHIGGLPYLLPQLDFPPVYATKLTLGLITVKLRERRILDRATLLEIGPGEHVQDVMSLAVLAVSEDTDIDDVRHLLVERRIHRVPVLRGHELVGVVSRSDVLAVLGTEWVCEVCGEVMHATRPPQTCPRCQSPTRQFAAQDPCPGS